MLSESTEEMETMNFNIYDDTQIENDTENTGMNISNVQSYTIEWVGGPREKTKGYLPTYPEGFNKTAIIKLRFKVFPDGTVGEILPLQKGDTALENIAINALKEWQFNSLEESAPQVLQEGVIAFIYKLE